jgi:hypothetical protein
MGAWASFSIPQNSFVWGFLKIDSRLFRLDLIGRSPIRPPPSRVQATSYAGRATAREYYAVVGFAIGLMAGEKKRKEKKTHRRSAGYYSSYRDKSRCLL